MRVPQGDRVASENERKRNKDMNTHAFSVKPLHRNRLSRRTLIIGVTWACIQASTIGAEPESQLPREELIDHAEAEARFGETLFTSDEVAAVFSTLYGMDFWQHFDAVLKEGTAGPAAAALDKQMGMLFGNQSSSLSDDFHFVERRYVVQAIVPGSFADAIGLKPGDLVLGAQVVSEKAKAVDQVIWEWDRYWEAEPYRKLLAYDGKTVVAAAPRPAPLTAAESALMMSRRSVPELLGAVDVAALDEKPQPRSEAAPVYVSVADTPDFEAKRHGFAKRYGAQQMDDGTFVVRLAPIEREASSYHPPTVRVQGTCTLAYIIDKEGSARSETLHVLESSDPVVELNAFDRARDDLVRSGPKQWKPGKKAGKKVPILMRVVYVFGDPASGAASPGGDAQAPMEEVDATIVEEMRRYWNGDHWSGHENFIWDSVCAIFDYIAGDARGSYQDERGEWDNRRSWGTRVPPSMPEDIRHCADRGQLGVVFGKDGQEIRIEGLRRNIEAVRCALVELKRQAVVEVQPESFLGAGEVRNGRLVVRTSRGDFAGDWDRFMYEPWKSLAVRFEESGADRIGPARRWVNERSEEQARAAEESIARALTADFNQFARFVLSGGDGTGSFAATLGVSVRCGLVHHHGLSAKQYGEKLAAQTSRPSSRREDAEKVGMPEGVEVLPGVTFKEWNAAMCAFFRDGRPLGQVGVMLDLIQTARRAYPGKDAYAVCLRSVENVTLLVEVDKKVVLGARHFSLGLGSLTPDIRRRIFEATIAEDDSAFVTSMRHSSHAGSYFSSRAELDWRPAVQGDSCYLIGFRKDSSQMFLACADGSTVSIWQAPPGLDGILASNLKAYTVASYLKLNKGPAKRAHEGRAALRQSDREEDSLYSDGEGFVGYFGGDRDDVCTLVGSNYTAQIEEHVDALGGDAYVFTFGQTSVLFPSLYAKTQDAEKSERELLELRNRMLQDIVLQQKEEELRRAARARLLELLLGQP